MWLAQIKEVTVYRINSMFITHSFFKKEQDARSLNFYNKCIENIVAITNAQRI